MPDQNENLSGQPPGAAIADADLFYSVQSPTGSVKQRADALWAYVSAKRLAGLTIPSGIAAAEAILGVKKGDLLAATPALVSITPNPKSTTGANTLFLSGNSPTMIQGTGLLTTTGVTINGVRTPFHTVGDTQVWLQPFSVPSAGSKAVVLSVANNPGSAIPTVSTTLTFTSVSIGTSRNPITVTGAAQLNKLRNGGDGNLYADTQIGTPVAWGMPAANPAVGQNLSSYFPAAAAIEHIQGMTSGLDGNQWTFDHERGLYRIQADLTNHAYQIDRFQITGAGHNVVDPGSVSLGADGNIWMTGGTVGSPATPFGSIWKCTYSGGMTEYAFPSPEYYPTVDSLCAGLDGNMWFISQANGNFLVKMDVNGNILAATTVPGLSGWIVAGMLVGPDGNFWLSGNDLVGSNPVRVIRIDPNNIGGATAFALSTFTRCPNFCVGPNANLFFNARISGQDSATVQMDLTGSIVSTVTHTGSASTGSYFGVCTDSAGRICAVNSGSVDGILAQIT